MLEWMTFIRFLLVVTVCGWGYTDVIVACSHVSKCLKHFFIFSIFYTTCLIKFKKQMKIGCMLMIMAAFFSFAQIQKSRIHETTVIWTWSWWWRFWWYIMWLQFILWCLFYIVRQTNLPTCRYVLRCVSVCSKLIHVSFPCVCRMCVCNIIVKKKMHKGLWSAEGNNLYWPNELPNHSFHDELRRMKTQTILRQKPTCSPSAAHNVIFFT